MRDAPLADSCAAAGKSNATTSATIVLPSCQDIRMAKKRFYARRRRLDKHQHHVALARRPRHRPTPAAPPPSTVRDFHPLPFSLVLHDEHLREFSRQHGRRNWSTVLCGCGGGSDQFGPALFHELFLFQSHCGFGLGPFGPGTGWGGPRDRSVWGQARRQVDPGLRVTCRPQSVQPSLCPKWRP